MGADPGRGPTNQLSPKRKLHSAGNQYHTGHPKWPSLGRTRAPPFTTLQGFAHSCPSRTSIEFSYEERTVRAPNAGNYSKSFPMVIPRVSARRSRESRRHQTVPGSCYLGFTPSSQVPTQSKIRWGSSCPLLKVTIQLKSWHRVRTMDVAIQLSSKTKVLGYLRQHPKTWFSCTMSLTRDRQTHKRLTLRGCVSAHSTASHSCTRKAVGLQVSLPTKCVGFGSPGGTATKF